MRTVDETREVLRALDSKSSGVRLDCVRRLRAVDRRGHRALDVEVEGSPNS